GLHVMSWHAYVRRHLGAPRPRLDRAITAVLLVLTALWLVPGLMFRSVATTADVPWLGVTYRFPEIRWTGSLAFVADAALLGVPMARYLRAARGGVAGARLHALALTAIFVTGVNDTLGSGKLIHSPQLLAVGFVTAVGALGWDLTRAFAASARTLDQLSRRLEELVGERTRALVATESALLRGEKMAAIGRLAAGVAHEIERPAAEVAANIVYLRDAMESGPLPADAAARLDSSLVGVGRITRTVERFLAAGSRARKE
ncbi:MAG TPA: hypothetical protein VLT33_38400, partial [Labilithrix sp.]|nr:hypothetical protein [Labilithrix sp.]